MSAATSLEINITPDWEGLVSCIRREGTPSRVHYIELFLDSEVQTAICRRFDLLDDLDPGQDRFDQKRHIAVQRFLGYDYVRGGLDGFAMPLKHLNTEDTAELQRAGGRSYMELHKGPITNWEEFENYPWPDPHALTTESLEWYQANLPDDMCIIGSGGFAHFAEYLSWLMGYETLCYSLYDQRDLVEAIRDRLVEMYRVILARILEFDRVKIAWGSDDMGFRTGTLISPDDLREFVLPGHKLMAQMTHDAGRPYLLHTCGKMEEVMEDLIEDVRIDARHSFEDVIEPVTDAVERYGDRIALLGGIDVDFLCRSSEEAVRQRVRKTLEQCMPGGGYCLGTGNSVANYIPVDNYLAMLDEGRKFVA
ncbi:MAG: uroporphyrinogen decarboxylase family protein [Planctomycetota bacterium]|jgi:uroporphyrinogen decarboxylase|nr:uroporphyrinogen decarboxylase family protein [Planctomycetota bacterium]MDP7248842.1 uroporphyrinogen decarboxylase family protein [Planctomycetota bacterium]